MFFADVLNTSAQLYFFSVSVQYDTHTVGRSSSFLHAKLCLAGCTDCCLESGQAAEPAGPGAVGSGFVPQPEFAPFFSLCHQLVKVNNKSCGPDQSKVIILWRTLKVLTNFIHNWKLVIFAFFGTISVFRFEKRSHGL